MYSVHTNEESAIAARLLGDMAEFRSQFGPWGDRLWLAADEKEVFLASPFLLHLFGEVTSRMSAILRPLMGMNAFAAAAILSYISLQDFLALRADQRLQLALPIPEGMIVGGVVFLSST